MTPSTFNQRVNTALKTAQGALELANNVKREVTLVAEVGFLPPETAAPNGRLQGNARGQVFTQLSSDGSRITRNWTFNGTPTTNTGWI